jgi:hypothetical protein
LARYVDVLGALYCSIAEVTETRVVIDSSKFPMPAALLRWVPGIEPYFVHLIRDPRGVVLSRQRKVARQVGDLKVLSRRHLGQDSLGWLALNAKAEIVTRISGRGRTVRIRYEDFVREPRLAIQKLAMLIGEEAIATPFAGARDVELRGNHTMGGNLNRFVAGRVGIREDDRWQRELRQEDRRMIEFATAPLLLRYKYRLSSS